MPPFVYMINHFCGKNYLLLITAISTAQYVLRLYFHFYIQVSARLGANADVLQ